MWNLDQTRTHLGNRLAEASVTFWSNDERDAAINDAQRLIAAITRGVPAQVTGTVDQTTPYLTAPGKLLGEYVSAGNVVGGSALSYVPLEAADRLYPAWRTQTGTPRWVIVAPQEARVYLAPTTVAGNAVLTWVSILPPTLVGDSDELFAGSQVMEKFQSPLLNVACAYLLLKERYDGDAERFYQMAIQEIQMLGIDPARIPPLREAAPNG